MVPLLSLDPEPNRPDLPLDDGVRILGRILAVDPGDARIGLAVSDPTGLLARPLMVIEHSSREEDARRIALVAESQEASAIVIGLPLDQEGNVGPQARKSLRLVEALREETKLPVKTWDESGTTMQALETHGQDELLDARAAAYLLQDYLDAQT
ncbi:MAG: Holliday junction resolvase RuvX [Anaerolineales bacterium]